MFKLSPGESKQYLSPVIRGQCSGDGRKYPFSHDMDAPTNPAKLTWDIITQLCDAIGELTDDEDRRDGVLNHIVGVLQLEYPECRIPPADGVPPPEEDSCKQKLQFPLNEEVSRQGWWAHSFGFDKDVNPYPDVNEGCVNCFDLWNDAWDEAHEDDPTNPASRTLYCSCGRRIREAGYTGLKCHDCGDTLCEWCRDKKKASRDSSPQYMPEPRMGPQQPTPEQVKDAQEKLQKVVDVAKAKMDALKGTASVPGGSLVCEKCGRTFDALVGYEDNKQICKRCMKRVLSNPQAAANPAGPASSGISAGASALVDRPKVTEVRRIIDGKYATDINGNIIKQCSGMVLPDDEPLFLLRAKDKFAVQAMQSYRNYCINADCTDSHIAGIDHEILKFERFIRSNPERMKLPGSIPIAPEAEKPRPLPYEADHGKCLKCGEDINCQGRCMCSESEKPQPPATKGARDLVKLRTEFREMLFRCTWKTSYATSTKLFDALIAVEDARVAELEKERDSWRERAFEDKVNLDAANNLAAMNQGSLEACRKELAELKSIHDASLRDTQEVVQQRDELQRLLTEKVKELAEVQPRFAGRTAKIVAAAEAWADGWNKQAYMWGASETLAAAVALPADPPSEPGAEGIALAERGQPSK